MRPQTPLRPIALIAGSWARASVGLLAVTVALGTQPVEGSAYRHIAVNATAIRDYVRPVDEEGKPRRETYVFAEGRFFGGRAVDRRLSNYKFEDVAKTLAINLAKQNYFPVPDAAAADLLIMVHWGTTEVFHDPEEHTRMERLNAAWSEYRDAAADNGGIADPGAINAALTDESMGRNSALAMIAQNAALLGYKPTLQREQKNPWMSATEQSLLADLGEERYFLILMAYDYRHLRAEKKPRVLWITRISVRSPGTNFTEAVPAIAHAGANLFGRHVEDLVRVNVDERAVEVEIGQLQTLGTVEDPAPASTKPEAGRE